MEQKKAHRPVSVENSYQDKKKHKRKKVKRRSAKQSRPRKLPRKLLFIPSSDKDFVESWDDRVNPRTGLTNRDPLDFPASWRMILCGKPGCGKTCMIKNIILRTQQSRKPFERIYVLHQDQYAREYDDINAEIITELPPNDFWMDYDVSDPENLEQESDSKSEDQIVRPKTLVIIDDICFKDLGKEQTLLLDRLCGFISTHCNVSLACLNQDVFAVNPIIRKCANIWCIWRPSDNDQLNTIARRCGFKSKEFQELFDEVATGEEDSIMIDKTNRTPYPLRKNGYHLIEKI